MAENELLAMIIECESELKTESLDYYCTNPITQPENVHKTSWLDDLGWI